MPKNKKDFFKDKERIGKKQFINSGIDMAEEFKQIALLDEKSAEVLCKNGLYNQSFYFYIQSMEKYIKSYICRKIDITNSFYAQELREMGHSLDKAINFYIKIIAGDNQNLCIQMENQIRKEIFKGIRISSLYNSVRYPIFLEKRGNYSISYVKKGDCNKIKKMYESLKEYIKDMYLRI